MEVSELLLLLLLDHLFFCGSSSKCFDEYIHRWARLYQGLKCPDDSTSEVLVEEE